MTSAYRPAWWTLAVSLLLHAAGIAFLLTLRSPEPLRARSLRVALLAPPNFNHPPPIAPKRPFRQPSRPSPRVFGLPDRLQPAAPSRITLLIPDPPLLPSPDVHSPELAPPVIELPPPPVRRAVAATGAFDGTIPSNPAVAHTEVKTGTFGDARIAVAGRRAVAATGAFDGTIPSNQAVAHTEVKTGTFGDARIAVAGSRSNRASEAAISSGAEILSKPRPAYTDEARRLQIEGEVLLEVLFSASGEARVLRMIRGLGYGLDESAIAAARAIHFRPARRGDAAVDSTAVVHIVFQLAY